MNNRIPWDICQTAGTSRPNEPYDHRENTLSKRCLDLNGKILQKPKNSGGGGIFSDCLLPLTGDLQTQHIIAYVRQSTQRAERVSVPQLLQAVTYSKNAQNRYAPIVKLKYFSFYQFLDFFPAVGKNILIRRLVHLAYSNGTEFLRKPV